MNRILQLSVSGLVLATLVYGCDASSTSVGNADAGAQGGGQAIGGTSGVRVGTGGARTNVGGAPGIGGRAGTGGSGAAGTLANVTPFCTLEAQVAAQLNCPGFTSQQALVTQCVATNALPAACQTPVDAARTCLSQQPVSSFTCSSNNDGTVDVNSGVCTSQANDLLNCALGGSGTGTCNDLTGCCAQLTGTDKTDCQQIVTSALDATCGLALSFYQDNGLCI